MVKDLGLKAFKVEGYGKKRERLPEWWQ